MNHLSGLVVAAHGRHCLVETDTGARVICHPRGKKNQVVVGDRVAWQPSGDEGTVERVLARRNLFYRQDEIRTKAFAANLDQVLILVAAEPEFSESQLARALIACEQAGIAPLVALNKSDLVAPFARAWQRLLPYRHMGYGVLPLSLREAGEVDCEHLKAHLAGKATLVLGPSGAGKSTLVNLLVPSAQAQTGEISQALNSGRHTTTSTRWYWVDEAGAAPDPAGASGPSEPSARTALIDSPGFQEFGLRHIEAANLAACMPDLRPHLADCRFYNCTHMHEPGCGVRAAVRADDASGATADADASISENRYRIYRMLFEELSQAPRY
ncbi:MAG: ribosome small subunit-dependent GTPase A [Comamonas sp.]